MRRTLAALLLTALLSLPVAAAERSVARSEHFVVYFGVVPAELAQASLAQHRDQSGAHGIAAAATTETHHVVVAVFDAATGARVDDATLTARHVPPRGVPTSKPLVAMPIGTTASYGNAFVVPAGRNHTFEVEITRGTIDERVSFTYDNLHGSAK